MSVVYSPYTAALPLDKESPQLVRVWQAQFTHHYLWFARVVDRKRFAKALVPLREFHRLREPGEVACPAALNPNISFSLTEVAASL